MHSHCCTNMQSCRLSVNHPGLQKEFNLSHFHTLTLWRSLFSHVAHSGTQPTSNACSLYKILGAAGMECAGRVALIYLCYSHTGAFRCDGECVLENWQVEDGLTSALTDCMWFRWWSSLDGGRHQPLIGSALELVPLFAHLWLWTTHGLCASELAGYVYVLCWSRVVSSWSTCLNEWMLSLDFSALDVHLNGCRLCK